MEKCFKHFHDFLASFSDCDAAPCCQLAVSTIGGHQALSRQPRCHHFHTHQLPHLHLCPPTPHPALRSPPVSVSALSPQWRHASLVILGRVSTSAHAFLYLVHVSHPQQCDLAAKFHFTWPKSCARLGVNFKTYRSERSRSWWKTIPEGGVCSYVVLTCSSF